MTKSELITVVSAKSDYTQEQVRAIVDCMLDEIVHRLARGEEVTISGFGRFEMRKRREKHFVNPKTKDVQLLAVSETPGFKASGKLKQKIKEAQKKTR